VDVARGLPLQALSRPVLRILQVGHGRYGREHAGVWRRLEAEGVARLAAIVVNSAAARDALAAQTGLPVHLGAEGVPLEGIDAVDIVTPAATHAALVRAFLPHRPVFVEKPLAAEAEPARALAALAKGAAHPLAVGHVYRFHPLALALREVVQSIPGRPEAVFGTLLNPAAEAPPAPEPALEMLHLFDLLDMLFGEDPVVCTGVAQDAAVQVSLRYPAPGGAVTNAALRLGWEGARRRRSLHLVWRDASVEADFIDQTITVTEHGAMRRIILPHGHAALEAQLRAFVETARGAAPPAVGAATGARIVDVAGRARPARLGRRPRVAVIGGGIFGATCAAELGEFCDVTLIERHDALLTEASTLNQWRYHHGFHYPRSLEMINEIKECRAEFEAIYGGAIISGFPSYYATARAARIITAERYLHTCRMMDFDEVAPPEGVLDPAQVGLCLRTHEGVFDADAMRAIMLARLRAAPGVTLAMGHAVVDGAILPDGRKRLVTEAGGTRDQGDYDYVVNATYANRNLLSRLFGFLVEPLRFDLLELLLLELPLPRLSATILDGPFTSLVSAGRDGLFTLSHIQHSLIAAQTTADGMPPAWGPPPSNRENLLRDAAHYMPVLRQARVVASRYGTRVVPTGPQDVDGRPTVVVDHGFGCWSMLGGKVNTSVANARQVARQIATQQGLAQAGPEGAAARTADEGQLLADRSPVGGRRG
jgi:predicted dehydrogenase